MLQDLLSKNEICTMYVSTLVAQA